MIFIHNINKIVSLLRRGKIMIYMTDTLWGLGCDSSLKDSVNKLYYIKRRDFNKKFILLVDSLCMLSRYISLTDDILKIINFYNSYPTTFIFTNPNGLPNYLISDDNTVGIRIVNNSICKNMIRLLDQPLISTSLNLSGMDPVFDLKNVSKYIIDNVDFIVKDDKILNNKPSRIIKIMSDYSLKILRY